MVYSAAIDLVSDSVMIEVYPGLSNLFIRPRKPQNPEEYSNYAVAHLYELMENYKPCILWNDINFPDFHKKERLYEIFAHFYSKICPGNGVVNDRWKIDGFNGDFRTPEYRTLEVVDSKQPWESNRGIGYSFGYNRNEGMGVKS